MKGAGIAAIWIQLPEGLGLFLDLGFRALGFTGFRASGIYGAFSVSGVEGLRGLGLRGFKLMGCGVSEVWGFGVYGGRV